MSASDRVDKFYGDMASFIEAKNAKKLLSEIDRLKTWMQKHQNETLTEGSKTKLVSCIEACVRYQDNEVKESALSLVSDYLTIPEGKLATSKAKKKFLNIVNDSHRAVSVKDGDTVDKKATITWTVIDINKALLFNLESDDGQIIDGVKVIDKNLAKRLKEKFEVDGFISVKMNKEVISEGFDIDGNPIV